MYATSAYPLQLFEGTHNISTQFSEYGKIFEQVEGITTTEMQGGNAISQLFEGTTLGIGNKALIGAGAAITGFAIIFYFYVKRR